MNACDSPGNLHHAHAGPREVVVCGITQYTILCGAVVGYTITAATGIM